MNQSLQGRAARAIAFYLPQFHPVPENDEWWGTGFTEWTNVARAQRLFPGHYQPHVPADLGFYDLRVPETRMAQAEMAAKYGIEAFMYWHYWFAGRRILERPFDEVLKSGEPRFPFCLGWANQTWTGIWHGAANRILIEQTYPGAGDYEKHFYHVLSAFTDERYVKVEGKPFFYVLDPRWLPEAKRFTDQWRTLAVKAGLPGLYLVGQGPDTWNPLEHGFDARVTAGLAPLWGWHPWTQPLRRLRGKVKQRLRLPTIYSYRNMHLKVVTPRQPGVPSHPCVLPNWDNTPRSGVNGLVFHGSSPALFRRQLRLALDMVGNDPPEKRIIIVKSWNEWAEGNHLEPDIRYGHGYLEALSQELQAIPFP